MSGRPAACYHVNLQPGFGGGEVYAAQFAASVAAQGIASTLFVHERATAWDRLPMPGVAVSSVSDEEGLGARLSALAAGWIVFHTLPGVPTVEALKRKGHLATGFIHMPLYDRDAARFRPLDAVFGVSRHVIASARAAGLEQVYEKPMYGMASLARGGGGQPIIATSPYDWDRRKVRDRLLAVAERVSHPFTKKERFAKQPGITLGIVSRITPIKQFPQLFRCIAPVLARHGNVNLEIFGSGGYASVRDLRWALEPIAGRARFWGAQPDVEAVYRQLDALLTGLPEKEALGLNVIEAQACGIAVLAPDAPPFDETVLDRVTGLRYRDPRTDAAADFESKLLSVMNGWKPDSTRATAHIQSFSRAAFDARVHDLVAKLFHTA